MLNDIIQIGLTFDDVLLMPAKSEVLPRNTDISTLLTRNIRINIAIVSAAMDTVTESDLAIAIAREGGIGFIHRAMSPERQKIEVDKVKKSSGTGAIRTYRRPLIASSMGEDVVRGRG